ncbi:MAG TPA: hypothetical protein VFP50_03460 [Anaeromyxobacteraceae bacterium]|nr:hypothetical protein [Anaeromyxobacteraceae bacterium]
MLALTLALHLSLDSTPQLAPHARLVGPLRLDGGPRLALLEGEAPGTSPAPDPAAPLAPSPGFAFDAPSAGRLLGAYGLAAGGVAATDAAAVLLLLLVAAAADTGSGSGEAVLTALLVALAGPPWLAAVAADHVLGTRGEGGFWPAFVAHLASGGVAILMATAGGLTAREGLWLFAGLQLLSVPAMAVAFADHGPQGAVASPPPEPPALLALPVRDPALVH